MITGFNQSNRPTDPREVESIILSILLIVAGFVCYKVAKMEFDKFAPIIELKLKFLGIITVYAIQALYAFILWMIFGIIHVYLVIKLMELFRSIFNKF